MCFLERRFICRAEIQKRQFDKLQPAQQSKIQKMAPQVNAAKF